MTSVAEKDTAKGGDSAAPPVPTASNGSGEEKSAAAEAAASDGGGGGNQSPRSTFGEGEFAGVAREGGKGAYKRVSTKSIVSFFDDPSNVDNSVSPFSRVYKDVAVGGKKKQELYLSPGVEIVVGEGAIMQYLATATQPGLPARLIVSSRDHSNVSFIDPATVRAVIVPKEQIDGSFAPRLVRDFGQSLAPAHEKGDSCRCFLVNFVVESRLFFFLFLFPVLQSKGVETAMGARTGSGLLATMSLTPFGRP